MVVVIETLGVEQLRYKLEAMAGRVEFAAPALELIVDDMLRVEEQVFLSQGRRGGGSWKFLDPETQTRKDREGGSPLILVDSGDLMESVTEREGKYSSVTVTDHYIKFGTSHPAARTHQFGDPERGIPARPFFKFTPFDRLRWVRIIGDYIMGRV